MKNFVIAFSIIIIWACCSPNYDCGNIEIENRQLKQLIIEFISDSTRVKSSNPRIISVSISTNSTDTVLSLHADKVLVADYYIGFVKRGGNVLYFYSNLSRSVRGLYRVIAVPKTAVGISNEDLNGPYPPVYKETYYEYYNYKNGFFKLQTPPPLIQSPTHIAK